MPRWQYQSILDAAVYYAYECEHCEGARLSSMPESAYICRDCAEICWAVATFMNRGSRFIPQIVRSCIEICKACANELREALRQLSLPISVLKLVVVLVKLPILQV